MFRAWKDTILSHYSVRSGKGLKNEKHRSSDILSHPTLSFFCALCNLAEGPPLRNLGLLNQKELGLLSSEPGFAQRQPNSPLSSSHFKSAHYRVGSFSLSNQSVVIGLVEVGSFLSKMLTRNQ
jgi:hypothetical protein